MRSARFALLYVALMMITVSAAPVMPQGKAAAAKGKSAPAKAKPAPANTKPAPDKAKAAASVNVTPIRPNPAANHAALAMAYRDNLVTFTKALRGAGSATAPVNVDVARPALAEMQRSYKSLMQQHDDQVQALNGRMDAAMIANVKRQEARLGRIGQQLTALDLTVNDPTPDPKEVAERSAEILKECAALSPLRGTTQR